MVRALAIAGRDEKADVQEVPPQEPGTGDVTVAVEAASINGIDASVAAGYLWDMLPHTFPVTLGRDFAGTVERVGDGVTGVAPGDRVTGVITGMTLDTGALTEAVTVPEAVLVRLPDGVTAAQAAAVGLAGVTAHDLVRALDLSPADVVLVSGANGGVGAFAVQLAAATGATVLGTARPGEAADLVTSLGARPVDHTADLSGAVRQEAPDGVTAVVHAAGDAAALAALLAPGGRLASALGATNEAAGRDDVTVVPVMAGEAAAKLPDLLNKVAAGDLTVPVARTYAFDDAAQALADFGARKAGKLVVTRA